MKKLFGLLLTAALLLTLCACGSAPAPAQTQPPAPAQTPAPAATAEQPAQTPAPAETQPPETDGGALITGEAAQNADGLNEFGLPDLSMYSAEEIWDMYLHPENWDEAVLTLTDGDFEFGDPAPYSDPEVDADYVFDLGEWHDYDPGDWTPGPDEAGAFDWSEFDAPDGEIGELPGLPSGAALPEKYAFLLPDGLRDGDMAMEEDGMFMLNLPDRSSEAYAAIVQAARDAGYARDAQETNVMGMQMFTAGNGSETITIIFRDGAVMVSFA